MTDRIRPLRLLIAGGGTGGHVLPAVAVIEELRGRGIAFEPLWVGSHHGVEREIATAQGIPFKAIQTGKLRRYFALRTFTDLARIPVGVVQAWRIVRLFDPDVIYSTGGAVSVPTVVAGSRTAPILTHEQTAQIGIANRTASRFAQTFAVGFEPTAILARQRHPNVVVTGNPVRASLQAGDPARGRARFAFSPDMPIVYVTGGARGASPLNARIEAILEPLLELAQVIHQVGPSSANHDYERLARLRADLRPPKRGRYVAVEFVGEELPDVYAMADVVVARSGAGTVSELGYLGIPSILIPLPGTWGDEQRKNANVLGDAGGAIVIDQKEATPDRLARELGALLGAPERRSAMSEAARDTGRPDAAARLVDELLKLAATHAAHESESLSA